MASLTEEICNLLPGMAPDGPYDDYKMNVAYIIALELHDRFLILRNSRNWAKRS